MYEGWIDTDASVVSVDATKIKKGIEYSVVFNYKVNDKWLSGTFTTTQAYRPGDTLSLRYDPAKPERNDLVGKEKIGSWAIALIVVVFGLVAVYMFFFR